MRRREFISLLGGAAAWPLVARAQQPERMRRIGVLINLAADDPESSVRFAAFLQGLQELGWAVGRNVRIDTRWGAGDVERYRRYATELVALDPDVILTGGAATGPLQRVTRKVPIVFAGVVDPVGAGFVESLGASGRQHHRLYPIRIWHEREVAGAAQADRASPRPSRQSSGIPP